MITPFDLFTRLAPGLAARYLQNRIAVDELQRLYDAAQPSQYHVTRTGTESGDAVMDQAGARLRNHSRYLDENHDLAIGVLDTLVNRTVGAGLTPTPMVRDRTGELHEDVNEQLASIYRTWARAPDTTGQQSLGEAQRLVARSHFRDGEVLIQHMQGGNFPHRGQVPYTVELLEADHLPFDLVGSAPTIVHGVEKSRTGEVVAFHLERDHPGDHGAIGTGSLMRNTIRIPAARVTHLKLTKRISQTRGVPIFHGVIRRLEDLKQYEDSERIAARVSAAFTAFIRKGTDYSKQGTSTTPARVMEMAPGMIFDNLAPGEEIGTIGSNRPNPNLAAYVLDQIRRVAAGTGTGASSISRNYTGTYSSQRQELVEMQANYLRLFDYFLAHLVRPVHERLVETAVLASVLRVPRDVDRLTLTDFEASPPAMPWIDPAKEVRADAEAVAEGFKSRRQVIRERNGDPRRVDAEIEQDTFTPASASPALPSGAEPDDDDDEEQQAA